MTITFSMTARDIVTKALVDRKTIGVGQAPKAKEMAYGIQALDLMLKTWAARGLNLWTDSDGTATITAGDPVVELTPRPVDVSEVSLVVSPTFERPLNRWERGDYGTLPNKLQVGTPLVYTPIYTAGTMYIKVWPVPATDMTISYSYARVLEDVADEADPIDVPQMWIETVVKVLASKLDALPGEGLDKLMMDAAVLERAMFDHDRPATYQIGAEY